MFGQINLSRLDFTGTVSEGFPVFVRFGKLMVIAALVTTTSAHWILLQTVAWTTMLADNLQCCSFHEAVDKTFDGEHPCCLCKAIAAAKRSEQKKEFTAQIQKLEFPPVKENFILTAPSRFQLMPQANTFAESLVQPPPTPPPRAFFV
jgi:hypothetical protein